MKPKRERTLRPITLASLSEDEALGLLLKTPPQPKAHKRTKGQNEKPKRKGR